MQGHTFRLPGVPLAAVRASAPELATVRVAGLIVFTETAMASPSTGPGVVALHPIRPHAGILGRAGKWREPPMDPAYCSLAVHPANRRRVDIHVVPCQGSRHRPYGTDCRALKAMPRVVSRRDGARTAPAKPLYSTLLRDRKRRATILNQGDARVHLRLAIGGRHLNCDRQWGVHYLMIAFHVKYKSESL